MQRVSPTYRIVFSHCVLEGSRQEEITNELRSTVGTSISNLSKARMNIQKMIPLELMQNIFQLSKRNAAALSET